HFVGNTLTAVMEWIEQDPAEGLRFLEALAEELRIFAEVSRERLIPIERELSLCRSHLAIMSCRKGTRFALETSGIDAGCRIPPRGFHTLLENAITHHRYSASDVVFSLRQESGDGKARFTLDAPLAGAAPGGSAEGLGLKYVRARLEESFPGRWDLATGAVGSASRTTIEVPA